MGQFSESGLALVSGAILAAGVCIGILLTCGPVPPIVSAPLFLGLLAGIHFLWGVPRLKMLQHQESAARFPELNPYPVLRILSGGEVSYANTAAQPLLAGGQLPPALFRYVQQAAQSGKTISAHYLHEHKQFALTFAPVDGAVHIYGIEMTTKHRTAEIITMNNQQLSMIVTNLPVIIFSVDMQGIITLSEGKLLENMGYLSGYMVGASAFEHYQHLPNAIAALEGALRGEHQETQVVVRGVIFNVFISPLHNAVGKQVGAIGMILDVTERQRMLTEREALATQLTTLINHLQSGVIVEDAERRIAYVNQTLCDIFHIPLKPDRLIGLECAVALHDMSISFTHPDVFNSTAEAHLKTTIPVIGEEFALRDQRTVERDYVPIVDDGVVIGHLWQYRDITARKRVERELSRERGLLRSIFNSIPDLIFVKDSEGKFLTANPTLTEFFGKPLPEIIGKTDIDFVPEETATAFRQIDTYVMETREPHLLREWVTYADGRHVLFETIKTPFIDTNGQVIGVVGVARNITEREHAQEEITRLASMISNSRDFMGIANLETLHVEYLNEGGLRMWDVEAASDMVIGKHITEFLTPESFTLIKQVAIPTAQREGFWRGETTFIRRNNTLMPVDQTIFFIWDEEGQPISLATIMVDVTEQKRAQRDLLLRTHAIEFSSSSISIADVRQPDLPLIYVNPAFQKMSGYSRDEVIGRNCRFMQGDDRDQPGVQQMRAAIKAGQSCRVVLRNYRKDGTLFYNEVSLSPVLDAQGELTHFIGIANNITDRIEAEAALSQARDQALEASRLKSEFLATMSHEIRTPMNGIIGMGELLLDTPLNDEQREFATVVFDEAQHLLTIINDILDFSKIEAGRVILEHLPFEVRPVVHHVVGLLKWRAEQKGLQLETYIAPDVPPMLIGDAERLRQILVNLVGNAVKFTEKGSVKVHVTVMDENTERNEVELYFAIADTGIGIPQDAHKRLFQPFTQADGSTTRKYGGTGLGLAISKRLTELMDGNMGMESTVDVGSTFWFTARFTLAPEVARRPMAPLPPASELPPNRGTILLVEDNHGNQQVATKQLARLGFQVRVMNNGAEAVAEMQNPGAPYHLILMDCQMPEMDGYEATRRIRAMAHSLPIVAMTANAMKGDRERCLEAGMNDYISKPVSIETLRTVLDEWLPEARV
ncbi:MAG: hypothetical protein OHK0046_21170 [Anaerolineae bacterium]